MKKDNLSTTPVPPLGFKKFVAGKPQKKFFLFGERKIQYSKSRGRGGLKSERRTRKRRRVVNTSIGGGRRREERFAVEKAI